MTDTNKNTEHLHFSNSVNLLNPTRQVLGNDERPYQHGHLDMQIPEDLFVSYNFEQSQDIRVGKNLGYFEFCRRRKQSPERLSYKDQAIGPEFRSSSNPSCLVSKPSEVFLFWK